MKSKTVFVGFVVSLALNLALAAWLVRARAGGAASAAERAASATERAASATTGGAGAAGGPDVRAAVASAAPSSLWSRLDSADFDELFRRLRAAGFTNPEIQAIMGAKIAEKYPSRFFAGAADLPYWRSPYRDYSDPKSRQEDMKRSAEESELWWKYVLTLDDRPESLEYTRYEYGELPVEKLRAMRTIEHDYQALFEKKIAERGSWSSADAEKNLRAAMDLMEKEKQADIAKLLTPEEYAEYELRSSRTATSVRYLLDTFKPSEAEYKTIFAIKKAFDEKFLPDQELSSPERQTMLDQMKVQVAAALGPERAEDFMESALHGSDKVARLLTRLDLPARTAGTIRNLQQDLTQQAATVRANAQLAPADRSAQLAALAQTARTQLTSTLGEQGFEAYNDMKGDWIRALEPKK